MDVEYVSVDKDILNFLKVIYFGTINDPFTAASNRAYRDMNRTIRFGEFPDEDRERLRNGVTSVLRSEISDISCKGVQNQEEFDTWHFYVCKTIRDIYHSEGVEFYYGQAQKWLNMTFKYLYVIEKTPLEKIFSYLHVPIDNYVFAIARKELGIRKPPISWSRWDDYEGQYMKYQKALRSKIIDCDPLRWEFKYWMREARQQND